MCFKEGAHNIIAAIYKTPSDFQYLFERVDVNFLFDNVNFAYIFAYFVYLHQTRIITSEHSHTDILFNVAFKAGSPTNV